MIRPADGEPRHTMSARKQIIENALSLLVLQGANYLLPLITFPYLVRVLGPSKFGLLAFAQAFVQYFVVVTDYGFNLTATREVAIQRGDPAQVFRTFRTVMIIKLGLMALSFTVMAAIVLAVPKFRQEWLVYFCSFLTVVGNVLFPVWLYQGLERMKYITVLTLAAKLLAALGIFALVHREQDYLLAAIIQGGGGLVAGAVGLATARAVMPIGPFTLPSSAEILETLRSGWSVFIASLGVTLFGNSNIFILGLFANLQTVGYFAVADKTVRAAIGLSIPISTAIYPRVSLLFAQSKERAIGFLRRVLLFGGAGFLVLSFLLFVGANVLARLITGQPNDEVGTLIRLMSIIPFTVFVDNVYGIQILLNLGLTRHLMRAILYSGAFSVIASLLVVPHWGARASAVVFTLAQTLVLLLLMIPVRQRGIRLLGRIG
jgi:polysaccharide transporter, PST family